MARAPDAQRFQAPARGTGAAAFTASVPRDWPDYKPRVAIAADIAVGTHYAGQLAEGVVDVI